MGHRARHLQPQADGPTLTLNVASAGGIGNISGYRREVCPFWARWLAAVANGTRAI